MGFTAADKIIVELLITLKGLKSAVNGVLGLAEDDLREVIGYTNIHDLKHWRDLAEATIKSVEELP